MAATVIGTTMMRTMNTNFIITRFSGAAPAQHLSPCSSLLCLLLLSHSFFLSFPWLSLLRTALSTLGPGYRIHLLVSFCSRAARQTLFLFIHVTGSLG